MDSVLQNEIESLRRLTTKQLQERFQQLFGERSPSSNRMHLFRRIAWRLQARAEGDLSERARARAAELAEDLNLRLRAPRPFWDVLESKPPVPDARRDARLPVAGTVLTRVYQGAPVLVKVLERGFEYNGGTYPSLSSIAYRVTGTRWNGFLFFGLNGRDRA